VDCSTEHPRARRFRGHPVLVAVVSPAAVGAVTALFRVPISTATIFIDVALCVMSPLVVDGVEEGERCLFPSRGWLLMD